MAEQHSRLEPFLLLARTTKGAAAAKVVLDATAASGVYVFSELLELPNIKDLGNDATYKKHLDLLRLFAHGTLDDYTSSTDAFLPLTPAHITKLKHLTLVSLALQNRSLPYAQLMSALQLSSTRELENLVIDVMYADLLGGKMHHHEQVLHVDWVSGRDLRSEDLVKVKDGLLTWCKNAETLLAALDGQITAARRRAANEAEDTAAYENDLDEAFLSVRDETRKAKATTRDAHGNDIAGLVDWADDDPMSPATMSMNVGTNVGGHYGAESFEPRMRVSSQRSDDDNHVRAKKRRD